LACARKLPRRRSSASIQSLTSASRRAGVFSPHSFHAATAAAMGPDPCGATSLPIDTRSFINVAFATRQPSPMSPTRMESGTLASLKNTSLKPDAPAMLRIGRTSTSGWCMSMMKAVRPLCFGASGSVRASSNPHFAWCAIDVQIFDPFTTHSSPSATARVASPATSDPAPGSLNSWHQISSAVKIGRRKRSRCSSVPRATMVGPHMPMPMGLRIHG
jgi:hypothetical protein